MTFGDLEIFRNGPKNIGHFVAVGDREAVYIKILCPWDSTKGNAGGVSLRRPTSTCHSKEGDLSWACTDLRFFTAPHPGGLLFPWAARPSQNPKVGAGDGAGTHGQTLESCGFDHSPFTRAFY